LNNETEVLKLNESLLRSRELLLFEIKNFAEGFLHKYPVSRTIERIANQPSIRNYDSLSLDLAECFAGIEHDTSRELNISYKKLILVQLMIEKLFLIPENIPLATRSRCLRNFERINSYCSGVSDIDGEIINSKSDVFLKLLGVSSLFVLPLGAQKVNKNILPLSWVKTADFKDKLRFTGLFARKLRARSPFYDMHTDSQDKELLGDFNGTGWKSFMRELSELLACDSTVLGAYGIGWFFDPKVWEVSPRLSYIGDLINETSGNIFRVGVNKSAIESALATSPTRRELYDQKLYFPCNYLALWDRAALLKWNSKLSAL